MNVLKIIAQIFQILNGVIVPLIFAIAFVVFLWGIFNYFIAGAGNDEKRKEGRTFAMYGIIGFAIMISVWGLVNILTNTFGFNNQARPTLPSFGGSSSGTNVGNQTDVFGSSGLPNGAECKSHMDAECASGECDWNSQVVNGQQIFVCMPQHTNTSN